MTYWQCDQRGDCCREPDEVLMTHAERTAILDTQPQAVLTWRDDPVDVRFVRLRARPCPLIDTDGRCTVYAVRPYNCRRFVCLRNPDEPWISGANGSCVNLDRRLASSYQAVAFYRTNQRVAQREWGDAHGWVKVSVA